MIDLEGKIKIFSIAIFTPVLYHSDSSSRWLGRIYISWEIYISPFQTKQKEEKEKMDILLEPHITLLLETTVYEL